MYQHIFERFKMHLSKELNDTDVEESFRCKWVDIENALYNSINKDQNVVRLANFFSKDHVAFYNHPVEILISRVNNWVDSVQGTVYTDFKDSKNRTVSNYSFSIMKKYNIIFNIANNLSGEHKQMKEIVVKKITNMFDDPKLIVDIGDFRNALLKNSRRRAS